MRIGITSNLGPVKLNSANYLNYVLLNYEFNKYPRAVIDLSLNNTDWLRFEELVVSLELNSYQTDFHLALDSITSLGNNEIQLQGYMCKLGAINTVGSKYLGDNSEKAIKSLGFDQKLQINKVTDDYFQLNETSLNSLCSILASNCYKGIYTISEKLIKSITISSIDSMTSKALIRVPTRLQLDRQFNPRIKPNKGDYEVTSSAIGGSNTLTQYSLLGKSFISPYLSDTDLNYISSWIFAKGMSVLLGDDLPDVLDLEIGDIVSVPNPVLGERNYIVTKLQKYISYSEVRSSYEIQGEL